METLSVIVLFVSMALCAALLTAWLSEAPKSSPVPRSAERLPDHDLSVLLVTPTSTAWTHSHVCTECHSPVGHEEFMTKICLTCGRRMRCLPHTAGIRKVVRHGRWVRQQTNGLLELKNGIWLPPSAYDAQVGTH